MSRWENRLGCLLLVSIRAVPRLGPLGRPAAPVVVGRLKFMVLGRKLQRVYISYYVTHTACLCDSVRKVGLV